MPLAVTENPVLPPSQIVTDEGCEEILINATDRVAALEVAVLGGHVPFTTHRY